MACIWTMLAFFAVITLASCSDGSTKDQANQALGRQTVVSESQSILIQPERILEGTGRVIVKFRSDRGLSQDALERAVWVGQRTRTTVHHRRTLGRSTQSLIAQRITSAQFVKTLEAMPEVEWVVEDRRQSVRSLPNDPLFAAGGAGANAVGVGQWFLKKPSDMTPSAIDAQRAWDREKGDPSLVVAVVDTGVIANHPDLIGKVRPGYDFVSDLTAAADGNRRDSDPDDPGDATAAGECDPAEPAYDSSWHGTQVAGLIAAATNNGIGVASVGRNVTVLPVRVLGRCGGYDSDIIAGMLWASGVSSNVGVGRGTVSYANPSPAQVINISLGSQGSCSRAYSDAISQILQKGVAIVAAAGNDTGLAVSSPANCPGVIAVAGIRHLGTKVGYSNIGPEVSVAAPAGNCVNLNGPCLYPLVTTTNAGKTTQAANTYSDSENYSVGTSFAAPLVAATVALMRSANPSLTPSELKRILQRTSQSFPIRGAQSDVQSCKVPVSNQEQLECYCTTSTCGAGMLNVYGAVAFAADLRESNQLYREDVDRYDPETNQLQISKVEVGATTYHNVIVTVKQLLSVGTQEKRSYATTRFDLTHGVLTVAEVSVGKTNYLNVAITIQDVVQVGVP